MSEHEGQQLVPKALIYAFLAGAVLMLPWTAYLAYSLPRRVVSTHYDVMWSGFDLLLVLLLFRVAYLAARRRREVEMPAAVLGSLLIVDAWFDIMTASGHGQVTLAILQALVVELPTALVCFALVFRIERKIGQGIRLQRRDLLEVATDLHHPSTDTARSGAEVAPE